ncbi:FtsX-like permease family protein [Roseivirga sp.]|uniref:FtsX-like permease family protein n=1 Tax=Roseivirga sp. TaxID=1964215 RepID=UPI003B8AFFE2
MSSQKISPPSLYTKLFRWFCKEEYYLELQGDLEEEFFENSSLIGQKRAARQYRKEVIKMIRPSVVKTTFINSIMRQSLIGHFLKISIRNLKKNLSYTLLNVVGFAAALAVCLFCINAIYSNYQLDKKFADGDRIYRVNLEIEDLNGPSLSATTQISLYQKVQEAIPEAENIVIIQQQVMYTNSYLKGSSRSILGQGVSKGFFEVFNFEMILGNEEDLFTNPKNIIITKKVMDQYYSKETVIGSKLGKYIISGVMETPSEVSHLDFEFLHSEFVDHTGSPFYTSWQVYTMQHLYLKLLPETDPEYVQQKLSQLSVNINEELNNAEKDTYYNYVLEPLAEVAQSNASSNQAALLDKDSQKMVMALILVTLIIAIFNYTNLAMASALTRTKEVGISKVLGSSRHSLIYQFLIETTLLSLLGLGFGLLIFKLLGPSVASFTDFAFQENLTVEQVSVFFLFALLTGLISGIIPGLFFSRLSILTLFRKSINQNQFSVGFIKKGIIITQVSVSLLVFTLGFLVLSQSKLILNQATPFNGEKIVAIDLPGSDSLTTVFRNQIARLNGVESIAGVGSVPYARTFGNYGVRKHHLQESQNSFTSAVLNADSGFVATFGNSIEWLTNKEAQQDRPYFLVNSAFAKALSDSIKSFDETTFSLGRDFYPVLGIINDLNLTDPTEVAKPAAILIENEYPYATLMMRLNEVSFARTLKEIGELYQTRYPEYDFYPVFFDDVLDNSLKQFRNMVRALVFVFASIIAITLMGQIGMAMYQAKTREKEIGIRKVLGASFQQVIQLLLRSTFTQLIIAGLIAGPAAYFIFQEVSPDFSVPLSLKFYHFAGAFLIFAILISLLVSSQTWNTVRQNPVDSLQNE